MQFNADTIVPVYSTRTRNVFWIFTAAAIIAMAANSVLSQPFIDSAVLLWCLNFFLIGVNFSKLGKDNVRDHSARYTSLKLTLTIVFAVLMGTSVVALIPAGSGNISTGLSSIKLLIVLIGNIVFLVSNYAFYYLGIGEKESL